MKVLILLVMHMHDGPAARLDVPLEQEAITIWLGQKLGERNDLTMSIIDLQGQLVGHVLSSFGAEKGTGPFIETIKWTCPLCPRR
jgi:hypothetical protein